MPSIALRSQLCFFLLCLILLSQQCLSASILFFYAFATHSHRTAIEPLGHQLVERGHNVTFLCPIKPWKPNPKFHQFVPQKILELYESDVTELGHSPLQDRLASKYANSLTGVTSVLGDFVEEFCKALLESPDVKPWMKQVSFDLVIVGYPDNKCAYAFAHYWNASVIASSASSFFTSEEEIFGLPLETSWLPRFALGNSFTNDLSFYDRVYNTINSFAFHFYRHWVTVPILDQLIREFFKSSGIPSIDELETSKTSLIFINQHFSEDYARSLPPSVVSIGGMHCTDDHKDLPTDLQEFIAGAGDDGFIFVSFGSVVKMSSFPDQLVQTFFEAIKDLKIRFLWRWDGEPPNNVPPNVLTRPWFPQQDILAHPQIKGFISHGGLMSFQQAIYNAVPVIIIPVVFDQPFNARKAEHHGIGIHLELSEITSPSLKAAILRLVNDKTFKERVQVTSNQFKDRPMSPIDTAVFWTEYVLRYGVCEHMKPLAVYQPWWERRLLDVWFGIFFFFAFIVGIIVMTIRSFTCLNGAKRPKQD